MKQLNIKQIIISDTSRIADNYLFNIHIRRAEQDISSRIR